MFATTSDFFIPTSLPFNDVDLRYFKLRILLNQIIEVCTYQRFTPSGYEDIGVRKF